MNAAAAMRQRSSSPSVRPKRQSVPLTDNEEDAARPIIIDVQVGKSNGDSTIRYIVKRTPLLNFLYFLLDDQPPVDDITKILESLALVAALVFTMTCAIPSFVATEELEWADCAFAPNGEYGCYDFKTEHDYNTISLALSGRSVLPTYAMFVALVGSVIMLFSLNSLSKTSTVVTTVERFGKIAAAVTGTEQVDLEQMETSSEVTGKWWDRMKWVVTLVIGLICYGSAYLIQAITFVVMVKFPSPYLKNRCLEFGYSLAAAQPIGRKCDFFNNTNNEMFSDGPGIGGLYILMEDDALKNDPSTRWWLGYYISCLAVILVAVMCGYATLAADIAAQNHEDRVAVRWRWVKVLLDGSGADEPALFHPKNSPFNFNPRPLRKNEVFLVISKANDEFYQVISVPWCYASAKQKEFFTKQAPAEDTERDSQHDEEAPPSPKQPGADTYYTFPFAQKFNYLLAASKFVDSRLLSSQMTGGSRREKDILGDYNEVLFPEDDKSKKLPQIHEIVGPLGMLNPLTPLTPEKLDDINLYNAFNSIKKANSSSSTVNEDLWNDIWGAKLDQQTLDEFATVDLPINHDKHWWECSDSFALFQTRFGEKVENEIPEHVVSIDEADYDLDPIRKTLSKEACSSTDLVVEKKENWASFWEQDKKKHVLTVDHLRLASLECGYVNAKFLSDPVYASRAIYAFAHDADVIQYYMGFDVAQNISKIQTSNNPIAQHADKEHKSTLLRKRSLKKNTSKDKGIGDTGRLDEVGNPNLLSPERSKSRANQVAPF